MTVLLLLRASQIRCRIRALAKPMKFATNVAQGLPPSPYSTNRAHWALVEVGVLHEPVPIDMHFGQHNDPRNLRVHSLRLVFAAQCSEAGVLPESVAMVMQAIDAYPEYSLTRARGTPDLGR